MNWIVALNQSIGSGARMALANRPADAVLYVVERALLWSGREDGFVNIL